MDRIQILAATSVVVALTVTGAAGCSALGGAAGGDSAGSRTPTPHSSSPGPEVYHRAAECLRAHGVPGMPDPTQNPQTGRWDLPAGTRKPPQSALNACRSILSQIPEARDGGESQRPPTAAEMAKLRQFGQCMRQHGLADFPDPGADGDVVLPQRYARLGKVGMRAQLEACHKYSVRGFGMRIQDSDK